MEKLNRKLSGERILLSCPICNRKIRSYWESRYNGFRAACKICQINWAES